MTRMRRWVVTEADAGSMLADLLPRIASDASTVLEQGSVFVDGRRTTDPALRLQAGAQIEVRTPRRAPAAVEILDEREGVVAALKPAELATEPDRSGSSSLLGELATKLQVPRQSLHAIGRLDVGVSGIVLVATDAAARRRATRARESGTLHRTYLGIAAGAPRGAVSGTWQSPVDGRHAETRWMLLARAEPKAPASSLLSLEPVTGRTHQLRVHASLAGLALYGDRRYGGPTRIASADGSVQALTRIALHAARSDLDGWVVEAPLPEELVQLMCSLRLIA